jgi:hypothetical protein
LAFTTAAESDCAKAVLKMKTAKKEKIKFKFERHSGCFIMISKSKLKKEFGKCNNIIRGTLYAANFSVVSVLTEHFLLLLRWTPAKV